MRVVAVIPARGGSIGIPKKNLALLAGRPLIEWTIDAGLGAARVDRVLVTSDDPQILAVASSCGAEILRRPTGLSTRTARSEPVLTHALEETGMDTDVAVLLQPTSPLRSAVDVDGALSLFDRGDIEAVISVSEPEKSPFKTLYSDSDGFLRAVACDPEAPFRPRQTLPAAWVPNGAIYAVRTQSFLDLQTFLPPRTVPFAMPRERSLDVDTPADLAQVERIWGQQLKPAMAV